MTEAEWLACTDPRSMLTFLQGKVSDRKLRLFACACCRFSFSTLSEDFDDSIERTIETAEWYADGLVGKDLRQRAERTAGFVELGDADLDQLVAQPLIATASDVVSATNVWALLLECIEQYAHDKRLPSDEGLRHFGQQLLYELFGPLPFRPITVEPSLLAWNDRTIPKIAQAIHDDRSFDRLPILADALEEAGCTNVDILNHCRPVPRHARSRQRRDVSTHCDQPSKHFWGCWAVDLLLGKR
jgi:hypothetical protein